MISLRYTWTSHQLFLQPSIPHLKKTNTSTKGQLKECEFRSAIITHKSRDIAETKGHIMCELQVTPVTFEDKYHLDQDSPQYVSTEKIA